jgi:uncharacterized protein YkwD
MSRPSFRRQMTIEGLERREVLSTAATGATQEALYLLNLARTSPAQAANWINTQVQSDADLKATLNHYGVNLQQTLSAISSSPAQPPLAWSDQLASSAQGHSQDMASNNFQSHLGSNGSSTSDRISAAGFGNAMSEGEDAFAYASSVDNAIEAFLVDWGVSDMGHRANILQPNTSANNIYSEVGIGVVQTNKSSIGPEVVTIDFARSANGQSQVVGTVYKDVFKTGFYESGDGLGGVQIKATNLNTGQTASTYSSFAGGYQMPLASGSYEVDAIQNGKVVSSQNITVGSMNVKADFNLSSPSFVSNSIRTPAPAPAPTPSPTQTPAAAPVKAPVVSSNQAVSQPSSSNSNGSSNTGTGGSSIMNLLSSITSWSSYRAGMTTGN